jgi:hypothetical protein
MPKQRPRDAGRRHSRADATRVATVGRPSPGPRRLRILAFVALCVACVTVAGGYAAFTALRDGTVASQTTQAVADGTPTLSAAPAGPVMMFRSTALGESYGKVAVAPLDDPGGPRYATALTCQRLHFAAGRGICLVANRGVFTTYEAVIFDAEFRPLHAFPLSGIPSRARVAPDGRRAGMTVFIAGHSYAGGDFSTRTSIIDTDGSVLLSDLEELNVLRDGAPFRAPDFNFWGVTFTQDPDRFYATLGTGGRTYLIEGNLESRDARIIYESLECPSISPDGTRVAFKKQIGTDGRSFWQPRVLDLATLTETPLAGETRSVDDQMEWIDDDHIAYGLPDDVPPPTAVTNVWTLAADGTGSPQRLVHGGDSPSVVR